MLTPQEKFDAAVRGLVAQGEPAFVDGACVYETSDGKRCAAGHCLTAAQIRAATEDTWLNQPSELIDDVGDRELMIALQGAHDRPALNGEEEHYLWRRNWRHYMRGVAAIFDLSDALLKELATDEWVAEGEQSP